jgi:hypothetical protein
MFWLEEIGLPPEALAYQLIASPFAPTVPVSTAGPGHTEELFNIGLSGLELIVALMIMKVGERQPVVEL